MEEEKRIIGFSDLTAKTVSFAQRFASAAGTLGFSLISGSEEDTEMVKALQRINLQALNLSESYLRTLFETTSVKICPLVRDNNFGIIVLCIPQDT